MMTPVQNLLYDSLRAVLENTPISEKSKFDHEAFVTKLDANGLEIVFSIRSPILEMKVLPSKGLILLLEGPKICDFYISGYGKETQKFLIFVKEKLFSGEKPIISIAGETNLLRIELLFEAAKKLKAHMEVVGKSLCCNT